MAAKSDYGMSAPAQCVGGSGLLALAASTRYGKVTLAYGLQTCADQASQDAFDRVRAAYDQLAQRQEAVAVEPELSAAR